MDRALHGVSSGSGFHEYFENWNHPKIIWTLITIPLCDTDDSIWRLCRNVIRCQEIEDLVSMLEVFNCIPSSVQRASMVVGVATPTSCILQAKQKLPQRLKIRGLDTNWCSILPGSKLGTLISSASMGIHRHAHISDGFTVWLIPNSAREFSTITSNLGETDLSSIWFLLPRRRIVSKFPRSSWGRSSATFPRRVSRDGWVLYLSTKPGMSSLRSSNQGLEH